MREYKPEQLKPGARKLYHILDEHCKFGKKRHKYQIGAGIFVAVLVLLRSLMRATDDNDWFLFSPGSGDRRTLLGLSRAVEILFQMEDPHNIQSGDHGEPVYHAYGRRLHASSGKPGCRRSLRGHGVFWEALCILS